MNKKLMIVAFYILVTTGACTFNVDTKPEPTKKATVTSETSNSGVQGAFIENDIEVEAKDVKVKRVYLVDEMNNPLEKNETQLGKKIFLVLRLDTGWTKHAGRSYIGAAERISTTSGSVVVDAEDIFKDYETEGFSAKDAEVINLSAVITQKNPGVNNFVVTFRVWDKKGTGEVKGKYKFSIVE